ncbi:hypothetical protein ACFV0O_34380 [Kitasatospora sp. NPDC059577]|uniref:hypothetical protein n=1 Tax=Kitasatospora sp. NPDC059577 TaxID=3346873 RepID=UPI003696AD6E
MEEAIRTLGADVAAKTCSSQDTVDAYVRLLARHGRLGESGELVAGTERYTALRPYVAALENAGRAGEAEAYLRGLIATIEYPGNYENALLELLVRQGRFDDAVEAVAHTFDDLYDGNLLQAAMLLLAAAGHHGKALELAEGRSPEFLAENERFWLRSNRWWLMGESGRCRDAIAEIEALPADEVDDRSPTFLAVSGLSVCRSHRTGLRDPLGNGVNGVYTAGLPDRQDANTTTASRLARIGMSSTEG